VILTRAYQPERFKLWRLCYAHRDEDDNAMNLIARVSLNNEDLGLGFYAVIARPGLGHNHLGLLSSPQLAA